MVGNKKYDHPTNLSLSSTLELVTPSFYLHVATPQAIQHFLSLPTYTSLTHHLFNDKQWQVLHHIHHILEIPSVAQELLSAEKTPTLSIALPAYEMLLVAWTNLKAAIPELSHYIQVGIAKILEYVSKGRRSRVYALAMSKSKNCCINSN